MSYAASIFDIKFPYTQHFLQTIRNYIWAPQKNSQLSKSFVNFHFKISSAFQNVYSSISFQKPHFNVQMGSWKNTVIQYYTYESKCLPEFNMGWVQMHSWHKQFNFPLSEWPYRTSFITRSNKWLIMLTSSKLKVPLTFHTTQAGEVIDSILVRSQPAPLKVTQSGTAIFGS